MLSRRVAKLFKEVKLVHSAITWKIIFRNFASRFPSERRIRIKRGNRVLPVTSVCTGHVHLPHQQTASVHT